MTDFKDLVQMRRSHRKYTDEEINPEDVQTIMRAALMSPTSKGRRAWHFVLVDNKVDIEKLADAKAQFSQFLKEAPLAIVVLGDPVENPCWIEDASVAAITMQYQIEDLGLGSCWIQMRNEVLSDGTTSDEVIRGVLDIPENMNCLCILAVGHAADQRKPQSEDRLKWENVHANKY
ncbi:MAG: nitroreductase family protein [Prevotella sp.]|nr:nitroreductase family protein [Prevotella sp.]